MSYYALFKGWLLLSKPPGCLRILTSFATEQSFRGLSGWSGLFPSRQWSLSPTVSLAHGTQRLSILSLPRVGTAFAARIETVLYPSVAHHIRLRLNAFRGEPASSEFDWYFTPNHNSSADFSTSVGSGLHLVLPKPQPGHG